MKECVIFGAGFYGKAAFYKLSRSFRVRYYVDNNEVLWGNFINGIEVVSPECLYQLYNEAAIIIFICCRSYMDIYRQLAKNGVKKCCAMVEGFVYSLDEEETPYPVCLEKLEPYKKEKLSEKNILYVQNVACIRTHKIAATMKSLGYKVFLLYTMASPEMNNSSFENVYTDIFCASTADQIREFVNKSEFDIIHSSNEPDILTCILVGTNKRIVFDTHDMMSLCGYASIEHLTLEYIANTMSAGLIHVTDEYYSISSKKYGLKDKPILILENLPLLQYEVRRDAPKLSELDGEIHCVYEGGMVFGDTSHARYFLKLWEPLAQAHIHMHFYTNADEIECRRFEKQSKYFHYEGNYGTEKLVGEMTKYDCGWTVFNVNAANKKTLENSSANKVYEYINAGLPIIVGDLKEYKNFVKKYKVGMVFDYTKDIKAQIEQVLRIKIPCNFLNDNQMTMESKAKEIENFYQSVLNKDK